MQSLNTLIGRDTPPRRTSKINSARQVPTATFVPSGSVFPASGLWEPTTSDCPWLVCLGLVTLPRLQCAADSSC